MDESTTNGAVTRVARREKWRMLIAEQQASGKSTTNFCKERGIPAWKFWYWRKALLDDSAANNGFVQMQVSTAQETASHVWVEVGRWRICVTPGFDPATLRQAAEALTAS